MRIWVFFSGARILKINTNQMPFFFRKDFEPCFLWFRFGPGGPISHPSGSNCFLFPENQSILRPAGPESRFGFSTAAFIQCEGEMVFRSAWADESNLWVTCAAVEWISPKVEEPRRGPISPKVFGNRPHYWLSRRDSKGFMEYQIVALDRSCRRFASGARPLWTSCRQVPWWR